MRHPHGAHPDRPGAKAGPVIWIDAPRPDGFDWHQIGQLDRKKIDEILDSIGMRIGERYDHDRCPIAGDEPSDAKACVAALDRGVFCHRCAAKGNRKGGHQPGFVPYGAINGQQCSSTIARLAKGRVHWSHAVRHLQHVHPNISEDTLRQIYELVVATGHDEKDPRKGMIFNRDLRVLFTRNGAIDADSLQPMRLSADTLNELPILTDWRFVRAKGGKKVRKLVIRKALRDRVRNLLLPDGYTPIQPARGINFNPDPGTIPYTIAPAEGVTIRLLKGNDLLSEDEAFERLAPPFPGLSRTYLMATTAAAICADFGGRPTTILAIGPTGAGKESHVALAASFLGDCHKKLAVVNDEEKFFRRIGSTIAAGHRFMMIDELLRRPADELDYLVKYLLELSSVITYRPLYHDGEASVPCRAAFFLTCGGVPDVFRKSPELRRRIWVVRLLASVPHDWTETCGGDALKWRSLSSENGRVANSILTHAFNLAARFDFKFDRIAAHLGLERPDEGQAEVQADRLRDLYRHCRNQDGLRKVVERGKWAGLGWVDARHRPCWSILEDLLPEQDADETKTDVSRVHHLLTNLQMTNWSVVLGIRTPAITLEYHRHHGQIVLRFRDPTKQKKGEFIVNEQLPPIPGDAGRRPPAGPGDDGQPGPWTTREPGTTDGAVPSTESGSVHPSGRNWEPPNSCSDSPLETSDSSSVRSVHFSEKKSVEIDDHPLGHGHASPVAAVSTKIVSTSKSGRNQIADLTNSRTDTELEQISGWTELRTDLGLERTELDRPAGPAQQPPPDPAQRPPPEPAAGDAIGRVLTTAGFPTARLVLDFETFFGPKFNLKSLSIPLYVHDPRFHIHGLAVRWPEGRLEFRGDVESCLKELQEAFGRNFERVAVVGHNLHFDGYILCKKFDIHPPFVVDTLALARHVHPHDDHDLAGLAKLYGLTPKGSIKELSGARRLSPQQWASLSNYACHDAELTHQLCERLLLKVSRPEVELRLVNHTSQLFLRRGLHVDIAAAGELLDEFEQKLDADLAAVGLDRQTSGGDEFARTLSGELSKTGRRLQFKKGKRGEIPALAKSDEAMQELLGDEDPRIAGLARARLAVKSAPQFIRRVQKMVAIARVTGGVLPIPLKYHTAHTGRFGGDGGVNLQNLAKRVEGLPKKIRGLLRAAPAHQFVRADLSQIEARATAWLAGQQDLIDAFRASRDIYSEFASMVLHEEVRKPSAGDPPDVRKKLTARRQLGKQAVLGLGFGMGSNTFASKLQEIPELDPLWASGVLTAESVKSIVMTYRSKYHRIPSLWHDAERAFTVAINTGESAFSNCQVLREGPDLFVVLPSSRRLVYTTIDHAPDGGLVYAGGESIYGGKIIENVAQAIARDILVDAMLDLEGGGLHTLLHVHDELVLEVLDAEAQMALERMLAAFRREPAWAAGFPVDAEGRISQSLGD